MMVSSDGWIRGSIEIVCYIISPVENWSKQKAKQETKGACSRSQLLFFVRGDSGTVGEPVARSPVAGKEARGSDLRGSSPMFRRGMEVRCPIFIWHLLPQTPRPQHHRPQ